MDWFSWLSKTGLDPSVVFNYSITFTQNELEEEDIDHFDHELLQSMGISIAKHRLEILKLAGSRKNHHTVLSRLLGTIKKTKNSVSRNIHTLVRPENSATTLTILKRNFSSSRWKKEETVERNDRRMSIGPEKILMLTDGGHYWGKSVFRNSSFASSRVDFQGSNGEGIRWDAMFRGLKPT